MSMNYLSLVHSQFLLPVTGVSPFRGFIRPALRAIRVGPHDFETLVSP